MSNALSPIFYLFLAPSGILYQKVQKQLAENKLNGVNSSPTVIKHCRSRTKHSTYSIPTSEWSVVVQRIIELKESLRTVAAAYDVSHETIRRIMLHVQKPSEQQEA